MRRNSLRVTRPLVARLRNLGMELLSALALLHSWTVACWYGVGVVVVYQSVIITSHDVCYRSMKRRYASHLSAFSVHRGG